MATRVENPLRLAGFEFAIAETSDGETVVTLTPHVCHKGVPVKWALPLIAIELDVARELSIRLAQAAEAIDKLPSTRQ